SNRQEAERLREAMQPLLERMEENNREALEEAEAALTEEQRAKAHELVQRERDRLRDQMRPRVIRRGWGWFDGQRFLRPGTRPRKRTSSAGGRESTPDDTTCC